jgi:cytochrome P450
VTRPKRRQTRLAGNVTTTSLIGNAVRCFLDYAEARVALTVLLERVPDLQRVGWQPLPPGDSPILHGPKGLSLRLA